MEFRDYTKYTHVFENSKIINVELTEIMKKISEAYTYNEYKKIIEINNKFREIDNSKWNLINKKIYEIIEEKLIKNDTYEELMKFSKNQKNSNNYALTLFLLIDIYKYKIFKIDSKEKNENFYKKIEKLKNKYIDSKFETLVSSLNKLNDIRNDAGHINSRENSDIIYFSTLLNRVIEIMSELTQEDIEKYGNDYLNKVIK